MARFKETNKRQGQFIPVIFEEQILPGTIEYAICDIVDNHIDTSVFDSRFKNDTTGAPGFPPAILLKIVLACYANRIKSSRPMEQTVRTNIQMMAIAEGLGPDHSTIATFISSMRKEIIGVFVEVLIRCAQLGLVGGDVFALDGCKISSNAAKDKSGTFAELKKKKEKLAKMLEHLINKHIDEDNKSENLDERREKYAEKIRMIDAFLESNEPKEGSRGRELKSNITDNESAKMKSSHGVIQGYNGMALVDAKSQVIVAAEAFGQGNEGNLLEPMMEQAEANLARAGNQEGLKDKALLADTNYFSEENVKYCDDKKYDAYIPDQYFRNRDPRFPRDYPRRKDGKKNLYVTSDFRFDTTNNCYLCPAGKSLRYAKKYNNHGHLGRLYKAHESDCSLCLHRPRCIRRKADRRNLYIVDVPKPKTFSEKMMVKIDTPAGREMYSRRMGIVEPVFANITFHKGLNRFTLRTKEKVNIQWLLYCIVHNIGCAKSPSMAPRDTNPSLDIGKIARYFLFLARSAVYFYFFKPFFIGAAFTRHWCDQE
jgi:transposase